MAAFGAIPLAVFRALCPNGLVLIIVFSSCNQIGRGFCGQLQGGWKELYENAIGEYSDEIRIERIPCESNYINAYMNGDEVDPVLIKSLHQALYNEQDEIGWFTLLVYDSEGKYLLSHSASGKFFLQTGD
jgi:hypothetical protein